MTTQVRIAASCPANTNIEITVDGEVFKTIENGEVEMVYVTGDTIVQVREVAKPVVPGTKPPLPEGTVAAELE